MDTGDGEALSKRELEDQFILRLPPKQARTVRKILRKKPKKMKKHVSIRLDGDLRQGVVTVRDKCLHAKLFDLPTIIEAYKTTDKVHLFKTADVCQILVCQEDEYAATGETDEPRKPKAKVHKTYLSPHGYTPPLKNVRKFRFRKTLRNKEAVEEAADIEKEILWLLRMDNEAVSSKFEFVCDDKPNAQCLELSELSIFGDKLSDLESDKESVTESASSNETNDIMDFTH